MTDFKALYDRVLNAQAAKQEIINQIDAAMAKNTDEGYAEALALEEKLDESIAAVDKAEAFYQKVTNAARSESIVEMFVPASETSPEPDEKQVKGEMKRGEFEALATAEREAFIATGGKIVD